MENDISLIIADIACYLPYNLKMSYNHNPKVIRGISLTQGYNSADVYGWESTHEALFEDKNYTIILRPMSDLYKEIDGVIGIVEIFKSFNIYHESYTILDDCLSYDDGAANLDFYWDDLTKTFKTSDAESYISLESIDKLYLEHYDVKNLIAQGKAIDIKKVEI